MKKIFFMICVAVIFVISCTKNQTQAPINEGESTTTLSRKCYSNEMLEEQMKSIPGFREMRSQIEEFTRNIQENPSAAKLLANGTIEIPVYVNVLYKTSAQNVSNAQIQSQIDALNADFSASNTDYSQTPNVFQGARSGDINVRFTWTTAAVTRKKTNKQSWQLNDGMKKSNQGGINPTNPTTTLNIWVCNLSSGYLGYAQFPGGSSSTDGIVIDDNAFGTTGTARYPFDKGRTATHEVGHWMNLYHIWGDDGSGCNGSDQVSDTPNQADENYGCPTFPAVSCSNGPNGDMFMNYMDYTDDRCMFMFSAGQKTRMLAVFAQGGPRYNDFGKP